ncbi:UNVERIFIED_CONTAM: putative LRR receptor-like serine/threonine-protein kinase [Sesamum angustifolium]|uniref:LRR receptor-like serine/threonine-protein kinase n=1 Tax=Sesamum angustifolium TaxID=2727405 RepID=A0AAW2PBH5_9LAMI
MIGTQLMFNVTVTDSTLEIRFYWAGKGTTRIPNRGDYGSLISAISVSPNFEGLELQTVAFTLKQIRAATNNFDAANKIGEGGFWPRVQDGTIIAVKQLSARSRQGNREFFNEIGMISCLQHPNLVKLYGCCIRRRSIACDRSSDSNENQLMLDWPTRFQICIGIARGLAFLREESRLKIVHRDIKATNVLLDKDLNPKISDFGLATLNEDEKTHVSTKIAGTIGYMAPEYALWGYLTDKADVYSFGVVLLEIANHLQESKKIDELIDERLVSRADIEEIDRVVRVALLCTNATPSIRPTMSEVVQMLEGKMAIPDVITVGSPYNNDVRFKAVKDSTKRGESKALLGASRRELNDDTKPMPGSSHTMKGADTGRAIKGLFEIGGDLINPVESDAALEQLGRDQTGEGIGDFSGKNCPN